jgi:hypothetical protein
VDFAAVSGWCALAGRWCSASLSCFSTELKVYLNGQWRELHLRAPGDDTLRSHSTRFVLEKCVQKYLPEVNYSATVFFVCLVISLSIFFFSCRYLPSLYLSLHFKALLV